MDLYGIGMVKEDFDKVVKKCENYDECIKDLEIYYSPWGNIYIGMSLNDIEDGKPTEEFQKSVEEKIEKLFGKKVKCYYCCDDRVLDLSFMEIG